MIDLEKTSVKELYSLMRQVCNIQDECDSCELHIEEWCALDYTKKILSTLDCTFGEKASKYQKKPVFVEAIRWTGQNFTSVVSFVGESLVFDENCKDLIIKTLEGNHLCRKGDYIIKGIRGEFYPCKADIFHETYREWEDRE